MDQSDFLCKVQILAHLYAGVAQQVEQLICNQLVGGSIPSISSKKYFRRSFTIKTIKIDLPAEIKELELHAISDLHLGDENCDFQNIIKRIEHIKNTPNAYCLLGGDLMDTAVKQSIGDTYSERLSPMEQLEQCCAIFGGIADKILAIVPGNHEFRIYKQDGIDTTAMMATQLGIADRYSPTSAMMFIRFGKQSGPGAHGRKQCYTVYATHGSGGGRKEGGKINRLSDLSQIVDADVYICGHTHLPAIFRTGYYRTSGSNSSVQYVSRLYVNTAASLNYGGYGDKQGYKPGAKESPIIYLDGTKKKAWAKV